MSEIEKESEESSVLEAFDNKPLTRKHIEWTTLSAFGDYLDAGALVAGAISAIYWERYFHIGLVLIALVFGLRQFGMWGGSLIAGPLGDRYGRKPVYMYDLAFYAAGAIIIAVSTSVYEMMAAYILLSIAIGIDVPTSWSLISEFAPKNKRGALEGFTNIFWYVGPIVIILIGVGTIGLGINVFRVVFGSLALVAIITWNFRRGIIESPRWAIEKNKNNLVKQALKEIGSGDIETGSSMQKSKMVWKWTGMFKYWKGMILVIPLYVLWGIPASTYGSFLPYFIKTYSHATIFSSFIGDIIWFIFAIIALVVVYIPLIDKTNRRVLYSVSSVIMVISFALLIIFPFSAINILILSLILFGFGQGVGVWPLSRLWSTEIFPTHIRNSAQGFVWSWNRLVVGIWTLAVPFVLKAISLKGLAVMFTIFFIVTLIAGGLLGPDSHGKSLEKVLKDFYGERVETK